MPKRPINKKTEPPPLKVLKTSKCPSLTNKSTLSYRLYINDQQEIFVSIIANTGGGYFGKDPVAIDDLVIQMQACPECITAHTISGLFKRRSVNTQSFILAALLAEGLIEPSKEKPRNYVLLEKEVDPFTNRTLALQEKQTPVRKRKPHTPYPKSIQVNLCKTISPDLYLSRVDLLTGSAFI